MVCQQLVQPCFETPNTDPQPTFQKFGEFGKDAARGKRLGNRATGGKRQRPLPDLARSR